MAIIIRVVGEYCSCIPDIECSEKGTIFLGENPSIVWGMGGPESVRMKLLLLQVPVLGKA
jgi:hypothetical protein